MAEKSEGVVPGMQDNMKIFRQRMPACILAALIFVGAAAGKGISVQAAGWGGGAPSDILVVYFSCTENTKAVAEHTEGSHCAVCSAVIVEPKRIPASGHHYWTDLVPATMQRDDGETLCH